MHCSNCGSIVSEVATVCPKCGRAVEKESANKEYYNFDYFTIETTKALAPEVIDSYENLGWELTTSLDHDMPLSVNLSFKRDRKINNKEHLTKIQTRLDDAFAAMKALETKKTRGPVGFSFLVGACGSLVLAGGVSLCISNLNTIGLIIGGVAIGIVGVGLCILAYPLYKKLFNSKSAKVDPLIAKRKSDVITLCEEARKYMMKKI